MNLGRKTTLALLGALIAFNLLLRYPKSEHEIGVDSFFIHALAGTIITEGHAKWILNPLSYFGWYPLSYPSAGPFLLVSVSSVTSLNLEAAILVTALMLGPVGTLGAFIMAREFRDDNLFAIVVALLYGTAPRFLAFTLWSASTRSVFMALLPLFIWALLRINRKTSVPRVAVMLLSLALLAATHRLVVLISVVVLAFVLAVITSTVLRIVRIQFPKVVLSNPVRRASPYIALTVVVTATLTMLFGTNVLQEYSVGELASGSELQIQLINLSINIARSAGLALALSLVGLVVLTKQRNKTMREPFLALTLLGLIPTFFLRPYTGFYVLPFLAIFGGLGFIGLLRLPKRHPRSVAVASVAFVLAISGFSIAVLDIEIGRSTKISASTYETGIYVREMDISGTMVANDGLTGIRVASVSGVKVLPVGGAGVTYQSPELLAYGFYSGGEVNERIIRIDILHLTIESDSLWIATGIQAEADWAGIHQSSYGNIPNQLQSRYQPAYYLEISSAPGQYLAYNNVYRSNLGLSIRDEAYRIYDNGHESLWWLHSPGITPQPSGAPRKGP